MTPDLTTALAAWSGQVPTPCDVQLDRGDFIGPIDEEPRQRAGSSTEINDPADSRRDEPLRCCYRRSSPIPLKQ